MNNRVEESGGYMPISRTQMVVVKREWPQKLMRFMLFFILLGFGMILGVIMSSHMTSYLGRESMLYFGNRGLGMIGKCNGFIGLDTSDDDPSAIGMTMRAENWMRPPSLTHSMNDEELLWRSSLVPKRFGNPFNITPKVAFMFLTRGPLPLAPIWEKFFQGHEGLYSIYVHAFPNYTLSVPKTSVFYKRQVPNKQKVEWGRMSMCDAERRLLANALLDISNYRFILLSESCIPIYNFTTVYNYLINSNHSFISSFDDKGPFGRGRYNSLMGPDVKLEQWRKSSQWFEVERQVAVAIVSDTRYYPLFKKYCTPACYVDEHYFPTMLSIEHGPLLANRSLTWVDWSRGGPHPATFGRQDISEDFFKRVRNANCKYNNQTTSLCFLFARKFAVSSLDPLLKLSTKLLGFG